MDEKMITSAAEAAVNDLQLDCQVASVYRRKDAWCIKFSGSYREFCDQFRSRYGEENSAEVVREKVKRHLLKSPKPTGRRRGFASRSLNAGPGNSLLNLPRQFAGGAIEQATRLAGEIFDGTVNAAETALKTVEDAASTAAQAASEVLSSKKQARPSAKKKKTRKSATKSAAKRTRKSNKKTARKTSRKRAAKKR
jgi:hypothetical protein